MLTPPAFINSPRRGAPVQINLSHGERDILRDLARRAGYTQSAYVRQLIAAAYERAQADDAAEAERSAA